MEALTKKDDFPNPSILYSSAPILFQKLLHSTRTICEEAQICEIPFLSVWMGVSHE